MMHHDGKPLAALILAKAHHPDEEDEEGKGDEQGLEAAAEDLITAIHDKDADAVVEALRNAFSILDAEPHEEGPHEGESEGEE